MIFYEIRLLTPPRILFAHHVITDKYRNRFPNYEDLLEVSLVEEGTILYEYEDGTRGQTPPGTLAPILKDLRCRTYTEQGVLQKHSTVGVIAKYELFRRHTAQVPDADALRTAVQETGTILIPYQWDLGSRRGEIEALLRRAISAHTAPSPTRDLHALSEWFSLTAALTELVLEQIAHGTRPTPAAAASYVRHAKRYVAEHYAKRPCVADIAAHLGISTGYLHDIFKQSTGMGVIEYLNRYAINAIKDFLKSTPLSLREAGERVGIEDPAYMSRLFRKTEGISYRQYCLRHAAQYEES